MSSVCYQFFANPPAAFGIHQSWVLSLQAETQWRAEVDATEEKKKHLMGCTR